MPATVRNVAREKLEQGQLSLGVGVRITRSVEIAKAMAVAGFDWLFLDMEHGVMSLEACAQISTAALDAETEHALFERYAAAARNGDGRITILVSHRFSTVRMADQIVVLDGARVAEIGTHETLMAKGGQYAELYGIQAASYR